MVFSLSIEEELKNKPFFAKKNLAKSLHSHIKTIAKGCGLPIFQYDETNQFGADFGSRFSNALQDVYSKGYDAVIAIGNDCLHLETRHIHYATEQLLDNNAVIGPTFDGGFYLLGIAKEDFEYSTFLDFSWNTETLYEEVAQTFADSGISTSILRELWDVDHFSDIEKLSAKHISSAVLRQIIQNIKAPTSGYYAANHLNPLQLIIALPFNKGSPILTSL